MYYPSYFYGFDMTYLVLVVPVLLLAFAAQIRVKTTYNRFARVPTSRAVSGAQAAQRILLYYGISDVRFEVAGRALGEHYDPRRKVIRLSPEIANSTSIAAVAIACHEAGHAAQHAQGYAPIKIRDGLMPVCRIGSMLGLPLAIGGVIFSFQPLIWLGLLLYALVAVFQLVTLPLEFNASNRALTVIDEVGMLGDEERGAAKKVLTAAALTYVASLAVTLANLLRMFLRFNRRR